MGSQSNLVKRDMVEQEERENGGKGEQLIILFNFVKNLVWLEEGEQMLVQGWLLE